MMRNGVAPWRMPKAAPLFTTWMMWTNAEAAVPLLAELEVRADEALGELVEADDGEGDREEHEVAAPARADAGADALGEADARRGECRGVVHWSQDSMGGCRARSSRDVADRTSVVPHAGGHTGPPLRRDRGHRAAEVGGAQ